MNYSLSNFKIFSGAEPHQFDLAPITMLIGENNSGKSTITKSLMLFQDFFNSIRRDFINGYFRAWEDYVVDFTIGDHKLGSYENILPFGAKDKDFKIGFSLKSEILTFGNNEAPSYEVEIVFTKQAKDLDSSLCLQAHIKEIVITIDNKPFYTYCNKKETICLTSISQQYKQVLKSIQTIPFRRTRTSDEKLFGKWLTDNSKLPTWKYDRLLDRLYTGGRIIFNEREEKGNTLEYIVPLPILTTFGKLSVDEFITKFDEIVKNFSKEVNDNSILKNLAEHQKWLYQDFVDSKQKNFGEYIKALENTYMANISNLVVDSNETPNLLNIPWGDIVSNISKYKVNKITDESKYEYVLSLICLPGRDDYLKHYYAQCLKNYIILLLGEVFLQNDKLVDFVHLGLDRAGMQRLYTFKSQGTGFNRILANYMKQRPIIYLNREETYQKGTFLRKWLRAMTKYDNIEFQYAAEGEGVYIFLSEKNNKQTLADVGYGMTPLVAVLIQIELAIIQMGAEEKSTRNRRIVPIGNEGLTIIIEEPESNLHPNYQALLADIFIDAYKTYGIEFILETHSEYLARKMQVLVKFGEIGSNNIIIHNLKAGENREIRILNNGSLSQRFWPGFYSEATSLMGELI